jgi:hypothetical protein
MINLWEEGSASLVFQAEIYEILACVHETETQYRTGKLVFALLARRLCKYFILLQQRTIWYDSARRR